MKANGYFRVAACVPQVNVADCEANASAIVAVAHEAAAKGARMAVFPEMAVTAYTCGDLFHNSTLLEGATKALERVASECADLDMLVMVGAPVLVGSTLYNCCVAMLHGRVVAVVPKTYLPAYNEFYEKRWWHAAPEMTTTIDFLGCEDVAFGTNVIIDLCGVKIAAEICEDLWTTIPPSCHHALAGAEIIANLSASDDLIGKRDYLLSLVAQQSARCLCGYVYASAGYGESSTDLVFDGKAFVAENGSMLAVSSRWNSGCIIEMTDIDLEALRRDRMHMTSMADCADRQAIEGYIVAEIHDDKIAEPHDADTLMRRVDALPFVPSDSTRRNERCNEIIEIQTAGLARRLDATHTSKLVVGISGGLDSTLALLVAVNTYRRLGLDLKGIIGVTMPGFGTTGRTYNNALRLMRELGVTIREIPIADAVNIHFRDIAHDPTVTDVTYENSQARERTQILMDVANQVGGMVLGTGDLSELALGWATYNGDHMSMYGVNAGVPKTLVRHLVSWIADNSDEAVREALLDIVDTPISPELTPAAADGTIAQKTEDLVGPYELHDFFLYYMLRFGFSPTRIFMLACRAFDSRFDCATILHWLRTFFRRFFNQQFKRSCLPDGPKVGSVCLSPRGDWRMPSDACAAMWLKEVEMLQKDVNMLQSC